MLDTSLYVAFLVAALALCLTPGPDMMFIVAMGGRGGPATGVMAAAGVATGALTHAIAAMLGLSALFTTLPTLYHVLRWAGAAYLLYLAVKSFRDRGEPGEEAAPAGPGRLRAFWQGVITNLLNPKVILFNIAFLPQFVNPSLGHPMVQFLVLGLTLVLIGLAVDGTVGLLSGRLARLLRRSRRVARGLNIFSGTVFTGLAVRLLAVAK
ncbi:MULTISPECIES: LysE family translocator [Actinomadura]|jgi:threonine/homoserine/homoserine lactone efflux protein|uniref:LysE family translocator n=1 Tax=Actinomadura montaniterrae TaxID=1803903 RepID=A0A6L3VU77_9ACTN|nr:LysE family translocator [Actinomadura montaniterrae]KAB2381639.1 LysE family translocator [Actinomadura montaniterrae]